MVMKDFFKDYVSQAGGDETRALSQSRYLYRLMNRPDYKTLSPFLQRFYESQFNPFYEQFQLAGPLGITGEEPQGFLDWLKDNEIFKTRRKAVTDRMEELQTVLGSTTNAEGERGFASASGVIAPLSAPQRALYETYAGDPQAQLQAALLGTTQGLHPLFQQGITNALQRLYFQLGGLEGGAAEEPHFLKKAKSMGLI